MNEKIEKPENKPENKPESKPDEKKPGRKSKKAGQGSPLPPDGSPLSAYLVGSCVVLGEGPVAGPGWYLVAFRIGGTGNPHVRKMANLPSSIAWNVGLGDAREVKDTLVVEQSAWPSRVTDERALDADSDPDPVLGNLRLGSDGDGIETGSGGGP